ncbi:hypothetical protein SDC9_189913 [bioreactor metagenome]|uniref:Uncharacterized protein n=1 Tax=bioreactor metagenome TaxID=1076179 RepID=A0A645HUV3_9ZZZZ
MQINSVRTRHIEFIASERVTCARSLLKAERQIGRSDGGPVNLPRIYRLFTVPAAHYGIAVTFKIPRIIPQFRQNIFSGQRRRHVPRRVNDHVIQRAAHHRRFTIGAPDDNARGQHLIAVLIINQRVGRNVYHDAGRQIARQKAQALNI